MKSLLASLILVFLSTCSFAQGENNLCNFGYMGNTAIDFNLSTPVVIEVPNMPDNQSQWGATVCFPNGQPRFIVRFRYNFFGDPQYCVYDPAGNGIAGSDDLLTDAGFLDYSMPVIIPRPGYPDQFYLFHSVDFGLYYSLLDMSLNSGQGAIVATEKNIQLVPPGSIFTRLTTSIKGCNGTYLVTRSQLANEFYSYRVSAEGIDTHKVISPAGNYSPDEYNYSGSLTSSSDGKFLATIGWRAVELFHFERCSGKITPYGQLDSTGNPAFFNGAGVVLPNHVRYNGVGFSPDGSKLYISRNTINNYMCLAGKLFQFDINQSNIAGIVASKTLILTNQPSIFPNIAVCNVIVPNPLGQIKAGPDHKIYIDNGSYTCLDTAFVPPGYNPGSAFHVLDNPNAAGLASLPFFNRIKSPLSTEFYLSGDGGASYPQNDIIFSYAAPDTIKNQAQMVYPCFSDSTLLMANPMGECLHWEDGSIAHIRTVFTDGNYIASYFNDCKYFIDTFKVKFIPPPFIDAISQSCEGGSTGRIVAGSPHSKIAAFHFIWTDTFGNVIKESPNLTTDTINGLAAGTYSVRLIYSAGCDTILTISIGHYPRPVVHTSPSDTMIQYGKSLELRAQGALFYTWSPASLLDTPIGSKVKATPIKPGIFVVIGMDNNGCTDTGMVRVKLDYTMPSIIPNAFSPNGDGLNDFFRVEGITYQKIRQFKIYNRFGQNVFSTTDPAKGWNGTYNSSPCPIGTYYYIVELEFPDGTVQSYKGDILLVR